MSFALLTSVFAVGAATSFNANLLVRPLKRRREPARHGVMALLAVLLFFVSAVALGAKPLPGGDPCWRVESTWAVDLLEP